MVTSNDEDGRAAGRSGAAPRAGVSLRGPNGGSGAGSADGESGAATSEAGGDLWSSRAGARPETAPAADASEPARALWATFAEWCSTGLLLMRVEDDVDDLRLAPVVAGNAAADNLLGYGVVLGAPLGETLDPSLAPDDWADLAAGLAGWGPQEIRVTLGMRVLALRMHRLPGHVALAIDDATHGRRVEQSLAAQAEALVDRDREGRALFGGLARRLSETARALSRTRLRTRNEGEDPERGRFDPWLEALDDLRDAVALTGDLAGSHDHTTGPVDLNAIVESVVGEFEPLLTRRGWRVRRGALPAIRGTRREVHRVVRLLLQRFVAGRPALDGCVLHISAVATRDGWRLSLSQSVASEPPGPASPEAFHGAGLPAPPEGDAEFCLAACRRIMRHCRGDMGQRVGPRGELVVWVEWPGHVRARLPR